MSNELSIFGASPMADMVAKAEIMIRSGFLPKAYNKPEAVIMACTIGAELGFTPMQSLNVINVIEGKPTLSLNACLALAQKNGGYVETIELTDTACKVRVTRPGRPEHIEEFTLVDASRAGLTGKQNWVKMPKNMLYARATSNAIRRVYADVLTGLYTTEEMQDATGQSVAEQEPVKVTRAKAIAKPAEVVVDAVLDAEQVEPVSTEPPLPVCSPDVSVEKPISDISVESTEHIECIRVANSAFEVTDFVLARKLAIAMVKRGTQLKDIDKELKERFGRLTVGGNV